MKTTLTICVVLIALLSQSVVRAQMLVNYATGNILFDDSATYDDGTAGSSVYVNTNFFGSSISGLEISINGNINVSGDGTGQNVALPNASNTLRISPLWDDLIINPGDGAKIVDNIDPNGAYYAVSWVNMETFPGSVSRQTFQAVLFGASTTIQGFNFLSDDIAFSYQSVSAPFADAGNPGATVGLDNGDGTNFVPLPGTTNGLINDNSLLPMAPSGFVLFRADGHGSYTASTQQLNAPAVPEAFTSVSFGAFLVLGSICLAARKRARRKV